MTRFRQEEANFFQGEGFAPWSWDGYGPK